MMTSAGEHTAALSCNREHPSRFSLPLQARRSGDALISLKGSTLEVLDWEKLKQAGDFDPTYLHLNPEKAAA